MINAISAADIAFIMSISTSAWFLIPLERSPQKQNGWTLRFCFWEWIMWKMYNKTIIEFGFRMISWIIKTSCLCYLAQLSASADNTDLGFDNSWYHAQPHLIIVYYYASEQRRIPNCTKGRINCWGKIFNFDSYHITCNRRPEPITRSLQLPNIPVTMFSQTDLFLVWINLEFRFPQEPQWPIAITSTD